MGGAFSGFTGTPVSADDLDTADVQPLSWVLVYGALLACWLFLRKMLMWAVRQPARSKDRDLIT